MDAQARLARKVYKTLAAAFEGATIRIDPPRSELLPAEVEWQGLKGMHQLRRQRMVNAALREKLTAAELRQLTAVFAFTPAEWRVMKQEAALSL